MAQPHTLTCIDHLICDVCRFVYCFLGGLTTEKGYSLTECLFSLPFELVVETTLPGDPLQIQKSQIQWPKKHR